MRPTNSTVVLRFPPDSPAFEKVCRWMRERNGQVWPREEELAETLAQFEEVGEDASE